MTQPDHAELSGDIAASIHSSLFPKLDTAVIRAIAQHDAGWAQFDAIDPRAPARGAGTTNAAATGNQPVSSSPVKPISFLEIPPAHFLRAWLDSIHRAEQGSPIGGILVSRHFSRLAGHRLQALADSPEDERSIRDFLIHETERQKRLTKRQHRPLDAINLLVDVLQFCDLLSLYVCCGAQAPAEFPQEFGGRTVRVTWEQGMCHTEPPIFGAVPVLACPPCTIHAARTNRL